MWKVSKSWLIVFLGLFLLTACGYTSKPGVQKRVYQSELNNVESAVNEYFQAKGALPVQQRDNGTPLYQRYPVAFQRLIPDYLANPPANAFVKGGFYEYVLVNTDRHPTVKLIDLRTVQTVQKLQRRIDFFRYKHDYTPTEKEIAPDRYELYFKSLGYKKQPFVKSPFTGHELGFVIGTDGKVHIDYRKDLNVFIKKYDVHFKPGDEIRKILINHSPFVPYNSFPYTVNAAGDPVFLINKKE